VVAVAAGRETVFWARFAAGQAASSEPELLAFDEAAARLGDVPTMLAGSAAVAVRALAPPASACEIVSADVQPDAARFAHLGALRTPVDVLRPLYLRPPDAKAQTSMVLPRAQP
jgi:tRNA A37 threonylcarbamoyladenosine modification protein TsaB